MVYLVKLVLSFWRGATTRSSCLAVHPFFLPCVVFFFSLSPRASCFFLRSLITTCFSFFVLSSFLFFLSFQIVAIGALGADQASGSVVIGGLFGKLAMSDLTDESALWSAYTDLEGRYGLTSQTLLDLLRSQSLSSSSASVDGNELAQLHTTYRQCCRLRLQMNRVRVLLHQHSTYVSGNQAPGHPAWQAGDLSSALVGAPVNLLLGLAGHLMDGLLHVCAVTQQMVRCVQ